MAATHLFKFNLIMFPIVVGLSMHGGLCLSEAMSTIKAMSKDQISCTMCAACDHPCQPIFSPPPPPYPSPPPPSPESYYCPPPPSPPPAPSSDYCPPPPSDTGSYYPPLSSDVPSGGGELGGSYYPPPQGVDLIFPPPPNPLLPYFPFYYNFPSASSVAVLGKPNYLFILIILISLVFHV